MTLVLKGSNCQRWHKKRRKKYFRLRIMFWKYLSRGTQFCNIIEFFIKSKSYLVKDLEIINKTKWRSFLEAFNSPTNIGLSYNKTLPTDSAFFSIRAFQKSANLLRGLLSLRLLLRHTMNHAAVRIQVSNVNPNNGSCGVQGLNLGIRNGVVRVVVIGH